MKRTFLSFTLALAAAGMLFSCGKSEKASSESSDSQGISDEQTIQLIREQVRQQMSRQPMMVVSPGSEDSVPVLLNAPNYRFVDFEKLVTKYNLAIDLNELFTKMVNKRDEEEKKHQKNLAKQQEALMAQYQNLQDSRVPLPSDEEKFTADSKQFEADYSKAQEKLTKMDLELAQTQQKNLETLMDSVSSYVKTYAELMGYDAVYVSSGTLYVNPELDITDYVVERLNARYNKK